MRLGSLADIASRTAACHQFHQRLEKELQHSAWQQCYAHLDFTGLRLWNKFEAELKHQRYGVQYSEDWHLGPHGASAVRGHVVGRCWVLLGILLNMTERAGTTKLSHLIRGFTCCFQVGNKIAGNQPACVLHPWLPYSFAQCSTL